MKLKLPMIALAFFVAASLFVFVLIGIMFVQRPTITLMVGGKVVAIAKQPLLIPWHDGSADVYVGKDRVFRLWENFLDGRPVFIYPFADGKRFLCDYDDDTAMLDFIVDLGTSPTNPPTPDAWPCDDAMRTQMASAMTNVVYESKGQVRLPNYAELQEVASYVANSKSSSIKAGYLQYFTREKFLLDDLATNRQESWPSGK